MSWGKYIIYKTFPVLTGKEITKIDKDGNESFVILQNKIY